VKLTPDYTKTKFKQNKSDSVLTCMTHSAKQYSRMQICLSRHLISLRHGPLISLEIWDGQVRAIVPQNRRGGYMYMYATSIDNL
jgi:hypothetical protein